MSTFPSISAPVTMTQYTVSTRVGYDYDRLKITFWKSGSEVTAENVLGRIADAQRYGFWFASDEVPASGSPISLQEAMRVVADDVDFALTELAKP